MNKLVLCATILIAVTIAVSIAVAAWIGASAIKSEPSPTPSPTPTPAPILTPKSEPSFRDKAEALLNENNITIIYGKLSISNNIFADTGLMKLELNDFLAICKEKGISTIFFYDGHLFGVTGRGGEGLWRHSWYWYFIDGQVIYYVRYEYRFGP